MKARVFCGIAVLAMGSAVLVPACADNEISLAVRGVLQPSTDTCEVSATLDFPQFRVGVLDAAIRLEYWAALLVENQMVPRGDPNKVRSETSGMELYAADVEIQS